ncbi:Ig-like domain-containing protein [Candidatus Azambacteria bacterium]|nr:Ig-like domain-containing protein [Candidatus Azambacteria bacterium]
MKKWRILLLLPLAFVACGGGGGGGGGEASGGGGGKEIPLSVSFLYPRGNQLVGGLMTAEVGVAGTGIVNTQFFVDDVLVATDSPEVRGIHSFDFDAGTLAAGTHTLKAVATNTSGATTAATVSVKVDPAELRKQALQFLIDHNMNNGPFHFSGVRRWAVLPITLEVSKEIVDGGYFPVYQQAAEFWKKYTGITFNVVPSAENSVDTAGKNGVVFFEYGASFGTQTWVNSTTLAYNAAVATVSGNNKILIAREIGRSLGIWSWADDIIIDATSINPVAAAAMKILYFELVPGAPVPAS